MHVTVRNGESDKSAWINYKLRIEFEPRTCGGYLNITVHWNKHKSQSLEIKQGLSKTENIKVNNINSYFIVCF